MKTGVWLLIGGVGILLITGSVVVIATSRTAGRVGPESTSALTDEANGTTGEPAVDGTPAFDADPAWIASLERALDPAARDTLGSAESREYRTMMILVFSFRESPTYEARVVGPIVDGVVADVQSTDDLNRNSIASGMLARTWILAGPNAEWADRFAQAALLTARTDDTVTQAVSLVLLEELAGSGLVSDDRRIEETIERLRLDAMNTMFAQRTRERIVSGDD